MSPKDLTLKMRENIKDLYKILTSDQLLLIRKVHCDIIYFDSVVSRRFIYTKLRFKEETISLGSCLGTRQWRSSSLGI